MGNKKILLISIVVISLFLIGLLVNVKRITPAPHMNDLDAGSLMDTLFALALSGVVIFLSASLGQLIIKLFRISNWPFIERTVIGLPLGLAIIGYGEFFLGILGWIQPFHQIIWLSIIAAISIKHGSVYLLEGISLLWKFRFTWKRFSILQKGLILICLTTIILALFLTFTPPWDYDGLMYHLEGPRLFLKAGRIIPIPENWFTYYPSTWEMTYMLGMALGSDIFARLIHFTTLILLFLATYAFGKRFLPHPGGWLSAAILVGIPILFLWGIFAYTDIAWALFQFLAISLFLIWIQDKKSRYLLLSGIMQGLALGSKYLAVTGAGILVLFIIWATFRDERGRNAWKKAATYLFVFGAAAFLVALPWYLKNFLWTGNPIFPLYLPQSIISPVEIGLWMDYVNHFGTGHQLLDYLLLPFSIFFQFKKFGTFIGSMDMPSLLFAFVFAYPWLRKKIDQKSRRPLDVLSVITLFQFIAWAVGSQQNRFLMPLYPGLSIITSAVLLGFTGSKKISKMGRVFSLGTVGGLLVGSLIFMSIYMFLLKPHQLLLGIESKSAFLHRVLRDYSAIEYINDKLPQKSKVFLPWNGRGYYCDSKCYPDIDQNLWTGLVYTMKSDQDVINWLKENNITHIFVSREDVIFFLWKHDPDNAHLKAYHYLLREFLPDCAERIYQDNWAQVFHIDYGKEACTSK